MIDPREGEERARVRAVPMGRRRRFARRGKVEPDAVRFTFNPEESVT